MRYGSIESAEVAPMSSSSSAWKAALAVATVCVLCAVAAVAVADVSSEGDAANVLAWVPSERMVVRLNPASSVQMLYDAALDPLYNGGADPIEPYKWLGANKDAYDPIAQNSWGDLPMKAAEIEDPDAEYAGKAPHDMSTSCDKKGGCPEEENVLAYLPKEEAQTLHNRQPNLFPDEVNVWANNPLDY